VIVEDVMTTGNSIKQAMDAVMERGVSVNSVVCVIDREDPRNVLKDNIKYSSLFTHSDFKEFIEGKLIPGFVQDEIRDRSNLSLNTMMIDH
jgi:orotate phosphoribosyltransferase